MLDRRPNLHAASAFLQSRGTRASCALLPEQIAQSDGVGPSVAVGADQGQLLVMTLSIDQVVEREGLVVSIRGSSDGREWDAKPILTLPEKHYCGMYSALLNLAKSPEARYLRVEWRMRRWGKGDTVPRFGFSVFAERSGARVSAAVA
jgi:hypothetical protein